MGPNITAALHTEQEHADPDGLSTGFLPEVGVPTAGDILKLGYLVETFPSPSETFIAHEVRCLTADCGADVTLFALRRGTGGLDVPAEVVYLAPSSRPPRCGLTPGTLALAADAVKLAGSPRGFLTALRHRVAVGRVSAELSRRGIRHLHAHFASLPTLVALMAARVEPVTVSFSAHARDIYVDQHGLAAKLSRAQLCITCAQANVAFLRTVARPGDAGKLACVYHGTDLDLFRFRPRAELASPARVLAAGRMVPKKGFETLLRACALLKGRREVACELVGDGPSKGRLERLSRKLGLGSTVLFGRWLAYESMPEAYACADVLVVPSVEADNGDRDGLPNVVVEAMASGTPVVASDISGIPEVVRDGQTGLLCPPGDAKALSDAVARVLDDGALRRRIVANARALAAEHLDCRKNTRRIYELLRQAAGCT